MTSRYSREERPRGEIINVEVGQHFRSSDASVKRGGTLAYDGGHDRSHPSSKSIPNRHIQSLHLRAKNSDPLDLGCFLFWERNEHAPRALVLSALSAPYPARDFGMASDLVGSPSMLE